MLGASETQNQRAGLLPLFFSWYFVKRPLLIIQTYKSYAVVFAESFSFVFLFRTLIAPWKNITDAYPTRGFNLNQIAQAMMFNVITRTIGCIVRLGAIFCGCVVQAALLAGFLSYLVLWLLFPVLLPLGILTLLGIL